MLPYIKDSKVSGVFVVVVVVVALPNFLFLFVVSPNSLASSNDFDTRSNQNLFSPGNHNIIKNYSSSLPAPFFSSNTNKSNDSQLTDSILQDKKKKIARQCYKFFANILFKHG